MNLSFLFLVAAVFTACGSEVSSHANDVASGRNGGRFGGCIDATLFSPQECHYVCDSDQAVGYEYNKAECETHGDAVGDLACFCPGEN